MSIALELLQSGILVALAYWQWRHAEKHRDEDR